MTNKKFRRLKKIGSMAIATTLAVSCIANPFAGAEDATDIPSNTSMVETKNVPTAIGGEKETVDTSVLLEKLEQAEKILETTPFEGEIVWKLANAVKFAKEELNDPGLTQERVLKAIETLESNIEPFTDCAPEYVTYEELKELFSNSLKYINQRDLFTEESFNEFILAYNEADKVLQKLEATSEEIDDAYWCLYSGSKLLEAVNAADKVELEENYYMALYIVDILSEDYLTEGCYAKLLDSVNEAQLIVEDPLATQEEVDEALGNINNAVEQITFTDEGIRNFFTEIIEQVDKEVLGQLMYTEQSWSGYANAKEKLQNLINDPKATHSSLQEAVDNFVTAFTDLDVRGDKVDKSELADLISQVEKLLLLSPELFEENSFENLKTVYEAVNIVYNDGTATGKNVLAATEKLYIALSELVYTKDGVQFTLDELSDDYQNLVGMDMYNEDELNVIAGLLADAYEQLAEDFIANYDDIQYTISSIKLNMELISYSDNFLRNYLMDLADVGDKIVEANKDFDMGDRKYHYYDFFLEILEKASSILDRLDNGDTVVEYDELLDICVDMEQIMIEFEFLYTSSEEVLEKANEVLEKSDKYTKESIDNLKAIADRLKTALSKEYAVLETRFAYEDMLNALDAIGEKADDPTTSPNTGDVSSTLPMLTMGLSMASLAFLKKRKVR